MPQLCCQTLASTPRLSAEVKLRVFKIRFNIDHFPGLNGAQCQRPEGAIPHPLSVCFTPPHHQSGLGERQTEDRREKHYKWGKGVRRFSGNIGREAGRGDRGGAGELISERGKVEG